jgi:hypothetical protein
MELHRYGLMKRILEPDNYRLLNEAEKAAMASAASIDDRTPNREGLIPELRGACFARPPLWLSNPV